jgi:TolA-binding protein
MKRYALIFISMILIIGFIGLGIHSIVTTKEKIQLNNVELQSTDNKIKINELKQRQLNVDLQKALQDKNLNSDKVKQLEDENTKLQNENADLSKQVTAKKEAQRVAAARLNSVANLTSTAYAATGCGDNEFANYIYMHESGCNPSSVNSIGCRGIGQACPGSKLPCGADYACQNAYFTTYANRYGGWAGAYSFWVTHHWW